MSRPKRITSRQLKALYWPAWSAARKVLVTTAGFDAAEAEEHRKEITGGSSKDLDNRALDRCLAAFRAISHPHDGAGQARLADQPLNRIRWQIEKTRVRLGVGPEYIESVAHRIAGRKLAICDESQLRKILAALSIHENRKHMEA